MPKSRQNKPNFTELTLEIVRESPEPLTFAQIFERVNARVPVTTSNPKGTVRNALQQSRSVATTGDGRYGWKTRLINGSAVRLTLPRGDWQRGIPIGNEAREMLWPTFFEIRKRRDIAPVALQLPDGRTAAWPLEGIGAPGSWGTTASTEFWQWFDTLGAQPGDHLIVTALDGEARVYGIVFQPRRARDEAAIAMRNQAVMQAALDFLQSKAGTAPLWDIAEHLITTGKYHDPVPPDTLAEIWTPDVWYPVLQARGALHMAQFVGGSDDFTVGAGDAFEKFIQALASERPSAQGSPKRPR